MEIFINNQEIKYSEFEIHLSIDKLISSCQIFIDDINQFKIGDLIYFSAFDKNPYLIFKVDKVTYNFNTIKMRYDTHIIGVSKENDLFNYMIPYSIQFNKSVGIKTILNSFGFNTSGENFNLKYDENIIFNIGDNLAEKLLPILAEHGYIFNSINEKELNIEKLATSNTTHIIETVETLSYSTMWTYENHLIYSDNYIMENNKWKWGKGKSSSENLKVKKSEYMLQEFTEIIDNLNKKSISNKAIIQTLLSVETLKEAIYPNQYINLSRLDLDLELPNSTFFISDMKITHEDKINITAKEII